MPPESSLSLQKSLTEKIQEGHPWVYRDALDFHTPLSDGSMVRLLDSSGRLLAKGIYDANSPIAVRIYSIDPSETLDDDFKRRRLKRAISSRLGLFDRKKTNAFRLCHGEGDYMPGLIVDLYDETAVVQFDGQGIKAFWLPTLVDLLLSACAPLVIRRVYLKHRHGEKGEVLFGDLPEKEFEILEHGTRFLVNVVDGQKTGFFLDQRENRLLIRQAAKESRVWNGFCYTGGFSVQAALGGAKSVVSVDSASEALATARRNFEINGLSLETSKFFCQDVLFHFRQAIAGGIHYDLVIVDPPSFAHAKESLPKALRAYRDLFTQAMAVTQKGGLLAASSCSSHVTEEAFLKILRMAAKEAKRSVQFLEIRGQPADHPTLPGFPEGRYLKFVLARLD